MKTIIYKILILAILVLPFSGFAANTYQADFEYDSDQYASLTNDIGITGGAITQEAWIVPESLPSNFYSVAYQGDTGTRVGYRLGLQWDGSNQKIIWERDKGGIGGTRIAYNTTLTTGSCYHMAGTYDATNLRLYLAASADSGHTLVAGPTGDTGNGNNFDVDAVAISTEFLGGSASLTSNFDGLIDDLRFWSEARSLANLDANWKTELVGNETNLKAYYKLNNDFTDETSGSFDLTGSGSPTFTTSNLCFTDVAAASATVKVPDLIFFQ